MKKYLLILMSFVLIMAASCTKETMTENPDRKSVGTEASNKTKALDYLDRLLEDLYGETKSGIPEYNPDNVEALTAGQICPTKSNTVPRIDNSDDTLLYIVNFNNNNGYAVLSAMTSAKNPVFCVTESGCITAEDFRKADEYLQSLSSLDEIEHDIGSRDPYINDLGETFVPAIILSRVYLGDLPINFSDDDEEADDDDEPARLYDTVVVSKVGPFLETKWTQWSPFNNFLNNKDIPAGCVAITTAQILAYNEVAPKDSFDGHPYDWDLMQTVYNYRNIGSAGEPEAQELVSAFAKEVGKRENCRIRYKEGGSSGYADGAKRTFKNYGYKDVKKYLGFGKKKQEKVIAQLTYGLPVYIDGLDKRWSGHAWVIDGFFVRNIYYASTGKLKEQERMFHCNWGWQGASDGYYSQGIFNTEDRIEEEETDTATSEYSHNYTWCYRPITYSL